MDVVELEVPVMAAEKRKNALYIKIHIFMKIRAIFSTRDHVNLHQLEGHATLHSVLQ